MAKITRPCNNQQKDLKAVSVKKNKTVIRFRNQNQHLAMSFSLWFMQMA